MNDITKTTSVAALVTLGLALGAPVRAAETELVGAQTPWRVFLRMGPYVGRKDGTLVGTLVHNRESRPGDFAKAEFLKGWTAGSAPTSTTAAGAGTRPTNWARRPADTAVGSNSAPGALGPTASTCAPASGSAIPRRPRT